MILKVPSVTVRPSVIPQGIDRIGSDRHSITRFESESADWLDLSEAARAESSKPTIREDLVQKLRASIASGQYLTADRLEGAVEGLRSELFDKR
ncbi:MAG: flagellar biosynthesis anti-sigma factor FlgM [Phycisphaerales bacterium]|nr:flagellar biosynthesis anti-sigma factor FlgM [Phycisphaerales bacterium]